MMKERLLITVCAVALTAGLGIGSATANEASAWEGFYGGIHTGYGQGNLDLGLNGAFAPSKLDLSAAAGVADMHGGLAGIHVGYNWGLGGNLVGGLEADIDYLIFDWDVESFGGKKNTDAFNAEASYLASLRARIGVDVGRNGEALLYVTGGVALTDAQATFHAGRAPSEKLDWEWGGVVGAGVETIITENLALRAEGLYYFFGDEAWNCATKCGKSSKTQIDRFGDVDLDAFTLRVGITYQFGTYN